MLAAALLLSLMHLTSAATQTPDISSCSENSDSDIISISNVTVSNAAVGSTMSFNYTMNISEKIEGSPVLSFQMSSGDTGLPCFQNIGSCSYSMCNGTNSLEEQINAPWNNECPIAPDSYENELNMTIPEVASLLIEEPTLHVKIQAVNSDQEMGCVEFNVTLDGV